MNEKTVLEDFYQLPNTSYVFDTSGIILLGEKNPRRLARLFEERPQSCYVTPEVLEEVGCANGRMRNARKKVVSDGLCRAVREAFEENQEHIGAIRDHEDYDLHRWLGLKMAYTNCREKKCSEDPMSRTDSHVAATGLALAAYGRDIGWGDTMAVVVSDDDHITESIAGLKNSIYGPANPSDDKDTLITPSSQDVSSLIPAYSTVRVPNLKDIVGR